MSQNVPIPVMNAKIIEAIEQGNIKVAQAAATDYTRTGIREGSFAFHILPPEKATDDMLERSLNADILRVVWDLEPESAGAKWVPLQTIPEGEYILGSRYVIPMARVVTPMTTIDIDHQLRTTRMDLRKVLTYHAMKDALAEIDSKFIDTVNKIVFDAPAAGQPNNVTGKVQWMDFNAALDRTTFAEATKMLPTGNERGRFCLRNHVCLMNEATARDWLKLDRVEIGGDLAERTLVDGLVIKKFMGIDAIFTLKNNIVPKDYVYFFAAPEYLGKCFYLTDWTMFMERQAYFLKSFIYWLGGFAFGNVAGVALARFNQQS